MSDEYVEQSDASPDEFVGQVEEDGAEASIEELPVLDIDQYGNYRVPVKVDGEEDLVPLAEARNGFMRQADYTRKTQELAQQRQELGWATAMKAALDQDPVGTLQLLSQHYGVQLTPQQAQQVVNSQSDDFDWLDDEGWGSQRQPSTDPRLDAVVARLERIEQERQDAELHNRIQYLSNKYSDFDPIAAVTQAVKMGTNDLEVAYKQLAFDRVLAEREQLAQQLSQVQGQRAAKQAASVVAGGHSPASSVDAVGDIRSVADAFRAAKRQLGG